MSRDDDDATKKSTKTKKPKFGGGGGALNQNDVVTDARFSAMHRDPRFMALCDKQMILLKYSQ